MLLVDGHGSWDGLEWINACEKMNIIVMRLPADTTHILQPCDQIVNRSFQRTVREILDHLLSMSHLTWANTAYKIKLAVPGYQSISPEDARASFMKCGLWPMNYRFVHFATLSESKHRTTGEHEVDPWSDERVSMGQKNNVAARVTNMRLQSIIH